MDFITDVCWHGASSCADERNIAGNFIGIAATLAFFKRAPFFALSLSFFFFVSAGGGLTQKCRTCMGVGGCFRDPKHKSNMYTFVQQRGGVHILSRITKV